VGEVVDLERERTEALARELAPLLRARGVIATDESAGDLDRFRRAARRAGRMLGWRVRTGASADGRRAWASSPDYVVSDEDRRRAGEAIDAAFFGGDAHGHDASAGSEGARHETYAGGGGDGRGLEDRHPVGAGETGRGDVVEALVQRRRRLRHRARQGEHP
jgi:hypothetical protein